MPYMVKVYILNCIIKSICYEKSTFPDPFEQARLSKGISEINDQDDPVKMLLRFKDVKEAAENWKTFQSGAIPGRIVVPSEVNIRDNLIYYIAILVIILGFFIKKMYIKLY